MTTSVSRRLNKILLMLKIKKKFFITMFAHSVISDV